MKILILSFYYEPDLCAGSFRCTALVKALRNKVGKDVQIDVLTTLPNRYASFNAEALAVEISLGLRIERIKLPTHKSGMLDQAKAFIHFARGVHQRIKQREYDLIFATSSRLMTAALGAHVARKKKAPLYLDIRDLFVDTMGEILSKKLTWLLKPCLSFIEKLTMKRAQRINLVSKGFAGYFNARYPNIPLSWFSNGIDPEFLVPQPMAADANAESSLLTVLYAGNLGEGQGLHAVIPGLAKRMAGRVRFKIIGDGGRKEQLVAALKRSDCHNVELLAPLSREALIAAYQDADILFLHLNDYMAFRKVLPSKIFEYAAMGKPIWAGVAGYAAEFIQTEIENAAIFKPCDIVEAENVFNALQITNQYRMEFIEKYKRTFIMDAMVSDMLMLV